jgi:uncharacterized protein (TIGR02145 family)
MHRYIRTAAALILAAFCLINCGGDGSGTFTDKRDGQKYRAVKIGGQVWMTRNLNYRTGNSWCYGDADSNCAKYGRLYDWGAAAAACPPGWHLPSRGDWDDLGQAAGGERRVGAGGVWYGAGKKLKAKNGWDWGGFDSASNNGTDDYAFSALPGGRRDPGGGFSDTGRYGHWWTSAEEGERAYSRGMFYILDRVDENSSGKDNAFSVRCVRGGIDSGGMTKLPYYAKLKKQEEERQSREQKQKAKEERWRTERGMGKEERLKAEAIRLDLLSSYFIDTRDGRRYRAVKIGGKTWMAQNLNYLPQTGIYWCYANDDSYCDKYGRMYDWKTARSVCPSGWHLPSRKEWNKLARAVGGEKQRNEYKAGTVDWDGVGLTLKSRNGGWYYDNSNGDDDYGFSAIAGGRYVASDKGFYVDYESTQWWSANRNGLSRAYSRELSVYGDRLDEFNSDKGNGCYVRCVADSK